VLILIVIQASFLGIAPKKYLRVRNQLLKNPNRVPIGRGYGRERLVAIFIVLVASALIYLIFSFATIDLPPYK
jgi:hypothetical protein